jgi:hypothetical protein
MNQGNNHFFHGNPPMLKGIFVIINKTIIIVGVNKKIIPLRENKRR